MTTLQNLDVILLQTKLNPPGVTRDLVVRGRLRKMLDAGVEGPLTLVVAPAGFGKTTLVSSWLQDRDSENNAPVAWLSLDEGDRDKVSLLRYFIGALRTIFPDACPETLNLVNARQDTPVSFLSDMLINELEQLPSQFILVLDDFYTLPDKSVMDFLNDFVRHWPHRMHMVILSRYNPPLPLAALRARGVVTEIRARDLRFSSEETAQYFNQVLGTPPDESAVSLLQRQIEGWIAGLKLITLSMDGRYVPRELTIALQGGDVYITDYLIDEVINVQPPPIQRFLLATSIVDRFCLSLCEALMSGNDDDCEVRQCLELIETTELFVTPLDNQREWFRFHRMFRELLQHRLLTVSPPDDVKALHGRAADWFAAHDLPDQAIQHALESGNLEQAAQVMKHDMRDVLNREDRPTLERWLHLMPEEFIWRSPELLMVRAWDHGIKWEFNQLMPVLSQVEALLDASDRANQARTLQGQIAALKAHYHYYFNEYEQAVACAQSGLALLPDEWRYAQGVAVVYMGLSLYSTGRADEAERFLTEHYESFSRARLDSVSLRMLMSAVLNAINAGKYEIAERTAQALLRQGTQAELALFQAWGHYLLGIVNYEWNALEAAARHFTEGADLAYGTNWLIARHSMIGETFASQSLGHSASALEVLDQLSRIDMEFHGREQPETASARARVMLAQGDQEAAERWADLFNAPAAGQSLATLMERSQLTRARILIARNNGADNHTAVQILDTVGEIAELSFNVRVTIEVLALRALAHLTRGDNAGARETLIRAIELGRRGVFTRTFVDLGPQMHKLLQQIAGHGPTQKTVSRILAAFQGSEAAGLPADPKTDRTAVIFHRLQEEGLDESLTPRELEVLKLLAEPIGLKVIAARMNITYATARRYTISIYGKFGVHSRWEAVDTAVRTGIMIAR